MKWNNGGVDTPGLTEIESVMDKSWTASAVVGIGDVGKCDEELAGECVYYIPHLIKFLKKLSKRGARRVTIARREHGNGPGRELLVLRDGEIIGTFCPLEEGSNGVD